MLPYSREQLKAPISSWHQLPPFVDSLSGFYIIGGSQSLRRGPTAYHLWQTPFLLHNSTNYFYRQEKTEEASNEFTDMIITQRGFQSNSKIITVSDEMLETLINMKR